MCALAYSNEGQHYATPHAWPLKIAEGGRTTPPIRLSVLIRALKTSIRESIHDSNIKVVQLVVGGIVADVIQVAVVSWIPRK